ncbi:MAG: outer membrane beta-barrel protein [Pseudomonadota bacterium]|nr:outer membrane beta-barrel protein [Pseudomonadota bacterium]
MKKITFVLTLLTIIGVNAKICVADSYKYTPYIGAGYQFSKTQAGSLRPEYQSGSIYVGSDYSKYFGTEVFYSQSISRKNGQHPNKIKSSYRGYGLDLSAYLPLDCQQKFSLLATAGIGEYVFNIKKEGTKHYNEHGYGYRFGGGFKYALDSHWQTRFITRYIKFDQMKPVHQTMEYSVNVEYHF